MFLSYCPAFPISCNQNVIFFSLIKEVKILGIFAYKYSSSLVLYWRNKLSELCLFQLSVPTMFWPHC